eukprot:4124754-Amphidinium_carterae.1
MPLLPTVTLHLSSFGHSHCSLPCSAVVFPWSRMKVRMLKDEEINKLMADAAPKEIAIGI